MGDGCPEVAARCNEETLLVNTPNRPVLGEALLRTINGSRQSIMAINPLLTDARMVDALVTARRRRVRVKIITELRDNRGSGVRYPTRGFEAENEPSLKEHFRIVRALAEERVLCRGLWHYAHGKVLIADDQQVVLSSANWTGNSLGWGSQPSLEAGISSLEPAIVSAWVNALSKLWEACPFRLHALDHDVSLQQEPANHLDTNELDRTCLEDVQMSWSYPSRHYGLRDQLANALYRARKSVVVSAMSFYNTAEIPVLHHALEEALARGVTVTAVVRPEEFSADRYPDPSTRGLLERGLILRGVERLHAKGMVVDGSGCGIFSANINPFSLQSDAESAHVECGVFVNRESPLLKEYGQFIEEMNRQATHAYRW